jgi:hypothetical protein
MKYLSIIIRVLWLIMFFTLTEVIIFLPVFLFGLLTFGAWYRWAPKEPFTSSMTNEAATKFKWAWLDELLGNHEDGLLPVWWITEDAGTAFGWFVRNPVANMRFWPVVSTLPDPAKVGWIGTLDHVPGPKETGWFYCWQGAYSGLLIQRASWGLWVGWKTNPRDQHAIRDYRWAGLGTTLQLWRS